MQRDESIDLEASENWDLEAAQPVRRTKPARAVVSVAFQRADFELVSESAEREGMRTSEFIRIAALEKSRPGGSKVEFQAAGGTGVIDAGARMLLITSLANTDKTFVDDGKYSFTNT